MEKIVVIFLILCLTVILSTVIPALAGLNHFWSGVAIGVGSAFLLGQLFQPPRAYDNDYRPVRAYNPPDYYGPSSQPPSPWERWVPGHWVENYGPNGNFERSWIPEHWERTY